MKFLYTTDLIDVYRDTKKGLCLIANRDIKKNTYITVNPISLIGFNDLNEKSTFNDYPMFWNKKSDCICFGVLNLLNHSETPNINLKRDYPNKLIRAYAYKNIVRGDELTIHYACKLWFTPV
jgi:hypothetical protein